MPLSPEEEKKIREDIRKKLEEREKREISDQSRSEIERQKRLEERMRAKIRQEEEEKFYAEKGYVKYKNRHGELEWVSADDAEERKKRRRKKKFSGYHSHKNKITRNRLINSSIVLVIVIFSVLVFKFFPTRTAVYGTLIICTDLPGAEIFLNAQKLNSFTPDTLRKIKSGNYFVSLFKEGYNIYPPVQMVSIQKNKITKLDFVVHSILRMGKVKINVNVPDAQFYVDGLPYFLGTDGVSEISEGYHTIMLVKKGYSTNPAYQRVFVKSGEVTELNFKFISNKQLSYIKVSDNLSSGSIYLNEQYSGMQANGNLVPVTPGLYEVKVLKNGYLSDPESQLIELTEGDERLIVFRLEATDNFYPVEIKSTNPGAMINIDGEYLPFVTPINDLKLSCGKHYLTLLKNENGSEVFETAISVGPKNKNAYAFSF